MRGNSIYFRFTIRDNQFCQYGKSLVDVEKSKIRNVLQFMIIGNTTMTTEDRLNAIPYKTMQYLITK